VLAREADRLRRQHEHSEVGRQQRQRAFDDAGIDGRIDPHGQVGPVLLDRPDRLNGDELLPIKRRELSGRQVPPPA
jgi:hypothetical protein